MLSIKREVDLFIKQKKKYQEIINERGKELTHPSHEFLFDNTVATTFKNLKWNFQEFKVRYSVDKNKFKVWKFYLACLLSEGDPEKGVRPYLTAEIRKNSL